MKAKHYLAFTDLQQQNTTKHFPSAFCTGSFDSNCGWYLFLAHKAQRVYIIDLLYFRFNPLVPFNQSEWSQKELTPLLPVHKQEGGLYNPHINFLSASVQHVNWKVPNTAAILIFATAKALTISSLLSAEKRAMCLEEWSEDTRSRGSILPSSWLHRCFVPLRADAAWAAIFEVMVSKSLFIHFISFMYFLRLDNKLDCKQMEAGLPCCLVMMWHFFLLFLYKKQRTSNENCG